MDLRKLSRICDSSEDWFNAIPIVKPGNGAKPLELTFHHMNTFISRSPDGKQLEVKRGNTQFSGSKLDKFSKVLKAAYEELGSYKYVDYYTLDRIEKQLQQ